MSRRPAHAGFAHGMAAFGLAALLVFGGPAAAQNTAPSGLPETALEIGGRTLTVEIAADDASRRQGLMFRDELAEDRGMLFVWDRADRRAMWMRNTLIPLDVAFIDGDGEITNVETMAPETTRMHWSAAPIEYALEVNAEWFARHGIEAGDRIPGLDAAREEAARGR
ncbi:hypothetical protein B1A74_12665 [Thioalkalivibrio halophilus]|uniref:DUF192 domain-containing protein n=2 Tax=Ectothiorhodospiraceae TaxID=72276 RepID=A0A1V2ZW92_9GAMM|nr:DUF192 domain-containing protein [Thioalkalivibrio halophilus]OOC09103.1 hypothetical protein B1A74_12665 [Thioalkalivibrio halophilus]